MIANRPGLGAIGYRAGTFNSFFAAMKVRLSSADYPGLADLRTRDASDWSIALLDGWAAVADVLTFYQERIANESYVRTATRRRSVLEIGRNVGYALRPGVAATAYLAYTMDPSADVTIPAGTRTQSVPPQGQLPQSFETSDALHARGAWNTLGVRTAQPQALDLSQSAPSDVIFQGANLNLKPDDVLLIVDPNHRTTGTTPAPLKALVRVVAAKPQTALGQTSPSLTAVTLAPVWLEGETQPQTLSRAANAGATLPAASADTTLPPPVVSLLGGYKLIEKGLLTPPAAHPSNALRLPQTIAQTFAANTDAVTQALVALHPALESTLLPALAQAVASPALPVEVYAFRINALPFGANAPQQLLGFADEREERQVLKNVPEYREWELAGDEFPTTLFLDRAYPALIASTSGAVSYAVVASERNPEPAISAIERVDKVGRAQYGISGTVSKLTLGTGWHPSFGERPPDIAFLRSSQVYAQSEPLGLAAVPIPDPVADKTIELDGIYDGLNAGRWLIVAGTRTDVPGVPGAELVMLSTTQHTLDPTLPGDTLHTTLTLANPLAYRYDRQSVQVFANVVRATHGESRVNEVLGSGDGGSSLQQFTLKAKPLTYVPVPTAAGAQSTLAVSVNGLPWTESASFDSLGPNDRAFVTRTDNAGNTTVVFGDGIHGARLPTGVENVQATYRVGIGQTGNVDAGLLTLLASKPLGVRTVTNPLPASGGADPEDVEQARANVPLATAALDRIVSVDDYAAVARTFAGVAKALAARFAGSPATVHVTIAADGDEAIDTNSPLVQNLLGALRAQGDAQVAIDVQPRSLLVLVLSANVALQAGYAWETVAPAIRAQLLSVFGFDRRALAQTVYLSEIVAAIVAVEGVASVAVNAFDGFTDSDAAAALAALAAGKNPPRTSIAASPPSVAADGKISPAQLAIFKPELPAALILQESSA